MNLVLGSTHFSHPNANPKHPGKIYNEYTMSNFPEVNRGKKVAYTHRTL